MDIIPVGNGEEKSRIVGQSIKTYLYFLYASNCKEGTFSVHLIRISIHNQI